MQLPLCPVRCALELDAKRDRDELHEIVVAEHLMVANFDEWAERGEGEAQASRDVEASAARRGFAGNHPGQLSGGFLVSQPANEVGHAQAESRIHRRAENSRVAANVVLVVEAVDATLDACADGNERRAEVEADRPIVARLFEVAEPANR